MIKDGDKDLFMTEDGDLYLGRSNNKIHLASKHKNEIIDSIIRRRLQSNSSEWRVRSVISSNLDVFKGMQRGGDVIEEIKISIRNSLLEDGLIKKEFLRINVLGLKENIIGIGIVIDGKDPSVDDTFTFKIMYDFRENRFTPLDILGVFSWWHV